MNNYSPIDVDSISVSERMDALNAVIALQEREVAINSSRGKSILTFARLYSGMITNDDDITSLLVLLS